MASEVMAGHNTHLPAPSPVFPGPLPQYPEMILSAIEGLNDKKGSNKSSISKQIESQYGNLPPAHTTLLTHHLNRMKSSGQLVFTKNNYMKPDPNAPPRRGRGRPPKPKAPLPPARPRGRPPKSLDPTAPPPPKAPATTTATLSGKKRGRPPKGDVAAAVGGPPKVKPAMAAPVGA